MNRDRIDRLNLLAGVARAIGLHVRLCGVAFNNGEDAFAIVSTAELPADWKPHTIALIRKFPEVARKRRRKKPLVPRRQAS